MTKRRFGVGIVGMAPGRSWGARAHLPALKALSDDFEVVGVANSNPQSSKDAADALGVPKAFDDVHALAASPDVDVVAVTVKVPQHLQLVTAAIEACKPVFCEWPLGNGLAEARTLAELAHKKGVMGVVGTQARVSIELSYVKQLIAAGYVGEVLSTTLVATAEPGGPTISPTAIYTLDPANGATLLTIPVAHTIAALRDMLGEVSEVSARLVNRLATVSVVGTGEVLPKSSEDQVLIHGLLESGAALSINYRGGVSAATGMLWEIVGTAGVLQITGPSGHAQYAPMVIKGAQGEATELTTLEVPKLLHEGWARNNVARNVGRIYQAMAQDLRTGTRTAPSFDDAVELHRVVAAIQEAARTGRSASPRSF